MGWNAEEWRGALTEGTGHRPQHSAVDAFPLGFRGHLETQGVGERGLDWISITRSRHRTVNTFPEYYTHLMYLIYVHHAHFHNGQLAIN